MADDNLQQNSSSGGQSGWLSAALGLVNPLLGLGSSLLGQYFGTKNMDTQHEYNMADASTAYERQKELMRMEWEYNSPKAQMQRYIDAGLNPNLIYGDVSAPGSPPTAPQSAPTSTFAPNMRLNYDPLQQQLLRAQVERLNTQNTNDNKLTDSQITRFAALNNVSVKQAYLLEQEAETQIALAKQHYQSLENMKAQFALMDEQKKQLFYENLVTEATFDYRINAENAEYDATTKYAVALAAARLLGLDAETAERWSQSSLNKQLSKESKSRVSLNEANIDVAHKLADYYVSLADKTDSDKQLVMSEISRLEPLITHITHKKDENLLQYIGTGITRSVSSLFQILGGAIH